MTKTQLLSLMTAALHATREASQGYGRELGVKADLDTAQRILTAVEASDYV